MALLDEFSIEDIEHWSVHSVSSAQCAQALHFDLERQRVAHHSELCAALQAADAVTVPLNHWVRVVDYQWSLMPLSSAGSIRGIGGRFNYGKELTIVRRLDFPCLYLASDEYTAKCERFGGAPDGKTNGLTREEYALRTAVSFTKFDLRGRVDQIFDLRDKKNLVPFVEQISKFSISKQTASLFKKFNLKTPGLIRSESELQRRLLTRPESWRQMPNAFGIPATCQIFGWFLREAGFEGVIYPSQQGGHECVAVFPENFIRSDSEIEVAGTPPSGASCLRLDKDNRCLPER